MKNVQTTFHEALPIALRSINKAVFQLKNEETRRSSAVGHVEQDEEGEESEGYFDLGD